MSYGTPFLQGDLSKNLDFIGVYAIFDMGHMGHPEKRGCPIEKA